MRVLLAALAVAAFGASGSAASAASGLALPAAGPLTRHVVVVRALPTSDARVVAKLPQFRPDHRPQIVLAIAMRTIRKATWYRIGVPARPNGQFGWIRATAADLSPVAKRIVIHRSARTIELWRRSERLLRARIAVGAPGMETPIGHFYVTARFWPTDPFYGPFGLETSAYSRLSDWPGGGVVGIHGTSMPWLLGQAVSHGCVRVANSTALELARLVPLGTPIEIRV